jgi:homogentisate 1,2-dioxygenase
VLDRIVQGEVPAKHHLALRDAEGRLRHEEATTRGGFDGPYTLAYHLHRPHATRAMATTHGWPAPTSPADPAASSPHLAHLARRHYRTPALHLPAGPAVDARVPLLWSEDLTLGLAAPTAEDPVYFRNGDGDELFFIQEGGGLLRSPLGDLPFRRDDYLVVPRGLDHRFLPGPGAQRWLWLEVADLHLPAQWRNPAGQLRMDAPYCHRDFRRVEWQPPRDEGLRELVVKRGGAFHGLRLDHSPLDVVGWDGAVYPFVFPILCFQPRVGLVHLPPTWHGTFAARGALICSFVPRPLDFHPEAVPCPYPHASVDVDELLFYVRGEFTSRRGVGPGSISHHPAGVVHGPHPGAYEGSVGARRTEELAVMLDCTRPLRPTAAALGIEDPGYDESFAG